MAIQTNLESTGRNDNLTPNPLFVFGISGATWSVMKPMVAEGHLPNIRQIARYGCSATVSSIRVPHDRHYRPQVAWATISTGVLPHRHGLTRFFHTADDVQVPCIWDYFRQNGIRVGMYGWPMTWPPSRSAEFVIPCHHARDSGTWPPNLKSIKAIDRHEQASEREGSVLRHFRSVSLLFSLCLRFRLQPSFLAHILTYIARIGFTRNNELKTLLLRHAKLELSAALFSSLYHQQAPGLSMFCSFLVDFASHRYWRYHEPEKFTDSPPGSQQVLRDSLKNAYKHVDKIIGILSAIMPQNSVVAVVSEHGMSPEPESTEVGHWRYLIRGNRLKAFVGLGDDIVACPVARWIAYRRRDSRPLSKKIAKSFRRVTIVETGLPLFNVHEHGLNEVVVKFNLSCDIPLYRQGNLDKLHVCFDNREVSFEDIARQSGRRRSAMHDPDAVFLLRGPGIRAGLMLDSVRIIDMLPTLMHSAGLPIPPGLDGSVLDIFER